MKIFSPDILSKLYCLKIFLMHLKPLLDIFSFTHKKVLFEQKSNYCYTHYCEFIFDTCNSRYRILLQLDTVPSHRYKVIIRKTIIKDIEISKM